MISAISWVPKGALKSVPEEAEPPSKEEIEEMLKSGLLEKRGESGSEEGDDEDMAVEASKQLDDVAHALAAADALGKDSKGTNSVADDILDGLKELDMDNYDDEDDGIALFSSVVGAPYYPSNDMDPYLKDTDGNDSEEIEDITIKSDDCVIVCGRTGDDGSCLEVWIMEDPADGDSNMYIHHDVMISKFPLCTAWLDCPLKGGEKGNFVAVGSMDPAIDIWDLDILDEVQPSVILGGKVETKKNGKKSKKFIKDSHTDSVLGLAWNKEFRNVLASASADKSVKIWDVATGACQYTLEHHTDKVQAVAWNHYRPHVLLSGSFDHSVVLKDGRTPSHGGVKWSVSSDVESLAWDPHVEYSFVVSLEDGTVNGFDIRTAQSGPSSKQLPSFTLHAHDKNVCSVSYNSLAPNLLATGSLDKTVKLWDLSNNQPSCIASKNPKAGAVFSIAFSEDRPFLLAVGGSKGNLEMWDTLSELEVSRRFGKFTSQSKP